MSDPLLTAEQVADLLNVPKTWVYEHARRGTIPNVSLGAYRRFRRDAILAWIEALETDGRTSTGFRVHRPRNGN